MANESGVQIKGNKEPGLANGLSPRELMEAAIALCTSITLESVLKRDGVEYNADEVHIQVVASKEEGAFPSRCNITERLRRGICRKIIKGSRPRLYD